LCGQPCVTVPILSIRNVRPSIRATPSAPHCTPEEMCAYVILLIFSPEADPPGIPHAPRVDVCHPRWRIDYLPLLSIGPAGEAIVPDRRPWAGLTRALHPAGAREVGSRLALRRELPPLFLQPRELLHALSVAKMLRVILPRGEGSSWHSCFQRRNMTAGSSTPPTSTAHSGGPRGHGRACLGTIRPSGMMRPSVAIPTITFMAGQTRDRQAAGL
jgi:hypothetical protein